MTKSTAKIVGVEFKRGDPWKFEFFEHGDTRIEAELSDGTKARVFDFYSDELSFTAADLIGKTIEEACALKHKRDVAYLRS